MDLFTGRAALFLLFSQFLFIHGTTGNLSTATPQKSQLDSTNHSWDDNGYVFYCPCHGRFGNQADQFLGSLAFAKQLNRTLILPPWRTYSGPQKMVPFDELFQVDPIRLYHRVILAKDFVTHLAPTFWPLDQRSAFCYKIDTDQPCTTDSEFFEEFWQFVGVPVFSGSESIKGLRFDAEGAEEWNNRFQPKQFPVIALRGPPAPFPVPLSQWPLQKYLKWSTEIAWQATKLITELFGDEPFLGVHLRNGLDWTRACALLEEDRHGLKNLMASSQCIGENPSEPVTKNMCFPTKEEVVHKISQILAEGKIKQVYIATDADPYLADFQEIFPRTNFVHLNPSLPQMDLYILGEAELFLGNCVSSFSSFVRRQRDVAGRETQYFGWQEPLSTMHKEL